MKFSILKHLKLKQIHGNIKNFLLVRRKIKNICHSHWLVSLKWPFGSMKAGQALNQTLHTFPDILPTGSRCFLFFFSPHFIFLKSIYIHESQDFQIWKRASIRAATDSSWRRKEWEIIVSDVYFHSLIVRSL